MDANPDPNDPAVWDALPHVTRGALRDRLTDPLARATDLHFDHRADGQYDCRAYDSAGRLLLTLTVLLDRDRTGSNTFTFVVRERVLPVSAEPEPQSQPVANDHPYTDPGGTVSFAQSSLDPDTVTVIHAHPHEHPDAGHPTHAHNHSHIGRGVLATTHAYGHWDDPHDHDHPDD